MAGLPAVRVEAQRAVLGLEGDLLSFIGHVVLVFREVRRVLRDDGTLWVNMGDSYANDGKWGGSTGGKHADGLHGATGVGRTKQRSGLKAKDLCGQPWRVAMALQGDGWFLRSDVIWAKPNPMPESVVDRPTKSHEHVFLLSKGGRYYYDGDAVRRPLAAKTFTTFGTKHSPQGNDALGGVKGDNWGKTVDERRPRTNADGSLSGANLRDVWTVATKPYPEAHFATFPPGLVEPCIKAGTSERGCCGECGAPWRRVVVKTSMEVDPGPKGRVVRTQCSGTMTKAPTSRTTGWRPGCECEAGEPVPCVVLDPFGGSGTTAETAYRLGRDWLLCEANEGYLGLIEKRMGRCRLPLLEGMA